jgi:hypothetical protein
MVLGLSACGIFLYLAFSENNEKSEIVLLIALFLLTIINFSLNEYIFGWLDKKRK